MSEKNTEKKSKTKTLLIILLVLVGVFVFVPAIFGGKSSNSVKSDTFVTAPPDTSVTTPPDISVTSQSETLVEAVQANNSTESDSDVSVSIKSCEVAKDYKGDAILVVTYLFSHSKDDPTSFSLSVSDAAYQNGIECDSTVISDYVDTQTQLNKIKPGTEYEVVVGYHLQDNTTNVEIIVEPLFNFSNKEPLCTQIVKLG